MSPYICIIIFTICGFLAGVVLVSETLLRQTISKYQKEKKLSEKHFELYMLMNDWTHAKQKGKNLADYFRLHNYKHIAIYGMNYVGETLISELKDSEIQVICGIDQNAENLSAGISVVAPSEYQDCADVIVVTPITFFDDIYDNMVKVVSCPIVSMEDILYEALKDMF